ncbi:MAG: DNA polymerase III subunit gamma/tau [Verrucomicrobiae bacterium]
MSYRVFARKYRPQTFDEVIGQDHITRTLQNAVSANRLAQAYLFVGPRGIGKTSTARILAKALNCVNGPTTTPCGTCDACREIAEGRSLDVIEIDGASNNSVENIRDLRDNAAYAPSSGPFKIYLIDEVHMLSNAAFNALLKTLEEPPPHVKFIFATTEAQKLPATITSRCQRFDLRRIPAALIAKHLAFIARSEKIDLEPEAAEVIARGAEGGLRDAESMLDQMVAFCGEKITAQDVMDVFGFTSKETVTGLANHLFARDAGGALGIVAEQSEAGKDLSRLTAELVSHLRDLLVSAATGNDSAVPRGKFLDLIEHFSESETRMKWVADKKLQLDVAVIKALHLLDETSLTDVIETLAGLSAGEIPRAPAGKPAVRPPAKPPAMRPASRAQEEPAAPPADPESEGASAASVWEKLADTLAKDSFIRFGWLREGVFERIEGGRLFVRFPASAQESSESMWMEQGVKDIEARLTRELSQKVRLVLEFDAEPSPAWESSPAREEPPDPAKPAKPPAASPADPAEDFKNDPLIKKALEVFKTTLQTAQP